MDVLSIFIFWCVPGMIITLSLHMFEEDSPWTKKKSAFYIIAYGCMLGWLCIFILLSLAINRHSDRKRKRIIDEKLNKCFRGDNDNYPE